MRLFGMRMTDTVLPQLKPRANCRDSEFHQRGVVNEQKGISNSRGRAASVIASQNRICRAPGINMASTSTVRRTASVLGIPIDAVDWETVINRISQWAGAKESRYVCICNVHSCVTARRNSDFGRTLSMPILPLQTEHRLRGWCEGLVFAISSASTARI